MKAVGYIRISQSDENPENQKIKIEEFASRKELELVGVFADIDVSGTIPPRERPQYRAMLEFCKLNNVKVIIFFDLSRLSRSLEDGLNELRKLLDEGFNIYFSGMEFLNYIDDPMLKKKIISDFLWFSEMYVEDIKKRTAVALERLKKEGKLYHRPSLIHYLALHLSGKSSFSEITKDDLRKVKERLRSEFKDLIELGVPLYRLHKLFLERYKELYRKYPSAPKSYQSVISMLKKVIK